MPASRWDAGTMGQKISLLHHHMGAAYIHLTVILQNVFQPWGNADSQLQLSCSAKRSKKKKKGSCCTPKECSVVRDVIHYWCIWKKDLLWPEQSALTARSSTHSEAAQPWTTWHSQELSLDLRTNHVERCFLRPVLYVRAIALTVPVLSSVWYLLRSAVLCFAICTGV